MNVKIYYGHCYMIRLSAEQHSAHSNFITPLHMRLHWRVNFAHVIPHATMQHQSASIATICVCTTRLLGAVPVGKSLTCTKQRSTHEHSGVGTRVEKSAVTKGQYMTADPQSCGETSALHVHPSARPPLDTPSKVELASRVH